MYVYIVMYIYIHTLQYVCIYIYISICVCIYVCTYLDILYYIYYIYIGIYPTHRHPHGPPTRSPVDHRADTRRCGPAHGRRTPAAAPAGGSWDPPPGKMPKKGWLLQQS